MVGAIRTAPEVEFLRKDFFAGLSRYEFLEPIGKGGMALVLKVRDLELNEVIAMKVLWGSAWLDSEMLLSRFKSEISLNRRIRHPNVCRLHDFGIHAEYPYLTMEWVPGRDLGRVLESDEALSTARVVRILGQTARGVAAAHDVGVVHRDLKPANLMIRPDDEVSILDFGLAHDSMGSGPRITEVGTSVGTPHYMSPEQVRGGPVDGRSDIYSIGVMAYEALAGCYLFAGSTQLSVALKHVEMPVPIEPLKDRRVSRELTAIVLRCLRKEPETRFQTVGELAEQFETLSRLLAPQAESPGTKQRHVRTEVHDRERLLREIGREEKPLVLIVDDEQAIRRLLARVVTDAGYSAAEAASGEEALQFLQTRLADLILMDVLMPGVDGFDTVRILKSQSRYAAIPILFMSQLPERNRVTFARQTGAVAFLPKPLDIDALVGEMGRILVGSLSRRPWHAFCKCRFMQFDEGFLRKFLDHLTDQNYMVDRGRSGRSSALLLVGVDRLPAIRAEQGPKAADAVLSVVSRTLQSALGAEDVFARWGDGAFLVVLGPATPAQLADTSRRLRALVNRSTVPGVPAVSLSVSIGATAIQTGDSADTLLRRVEKLARKAREGGGDRIESDREEPGLQSVEPEEASPPIPEPDEAPRSQKELERQLKIRTIPLYVPPEIRATMRAGRRRT